MSESPRVGTTLISWFLIEVSFFFLSKLQCILPWDPQKTHQDMTKSGPEWVLLSDNMKFIKEERIRNIEVVIIHVGKPINAIDCKDAQLGVTKNYYQNHLFYFTYKQFLSRSLIPFTCAYYMEFIFNSYFRHPLLCCDLFKRQYWDD